MMAIRRRKIAIALVAFDNQGLIVEAVDLPARQNRRSPRRWKKLMRARPDVARVVTEPVFEIVTAAH